MSVRTTDAAVIGGGLMGAWTAFFLARRRKRVILLEKAAVGAQSSGVNFGNLRLQGRYPGQYPLALRSHALWEEVEALIGEACEFEATGHLYVASSAEEHEKLEQCAEEAEAHGIAIERVLGEELRRRWPWLAEGLHSATYSARDATANPRLVTPAAARAAQRLGAEIVENTRVTEVRRDGEGFAVETDTGLRVHCGVVVNTAGAWALDIAERFGETAPMFAAGPPQFVTEPLPYRILPSVQAVSGSVIFRQIPRGNVIVAGYPRTASDPVLNRAPVPPMKTLAGMGHLARMAPMLRGAHVIRVWSGIEGYCPDMLPVIGPSETTPGLFHAFGFCGHGFQLGPGVGAVLTELIADGTSLTPLTPFSIGRFAREVVISEKFVREFDAPVTKPS
ncbi:MAG: FAD-binding oxidoreductase [Pseudomonadota bacterium]|nr:FAD-binding oxidoreductase [Pseudomonadota bacterium]